MNVAIIRRRTNHVVRINNRFEKQHRAKRICIREKGGSVLSDQNERDVRRLNKQ